MKTQETKPTLNEIVEPLLDILNDQYRSGDLEYLIPWMDHFSVLKHGRGGVIIEIPDDVNEDPLALRAIMTVLKVTGSLTTWGPGAEPGDREVDGPLRFSYTKRSAWAGDYWAGGRYLIVERSDGELDCESAIRQIEKLVTRLSDPTTLAVATSQELSATF